MCQVLSWGLRTKPLIHHPIRYKPSYYVPGRILATIEQTILHPQIHREITMDLNGGVLGSVSYKY